MNQFLRIGIWSGLALIGVCSFVMAAPTWTIIPDATPEENRQIQKVFARLDEPATAKSLLRDVLASHPQNRQARVMLGRLLLLEGKSKDAQDTIKSLTEGRTVYRPAVLLFLEIAKATGNKKLELLNHKRLVSTRPKSSYRLGTEAEAEGKAAQAEKFFKRTVAECSEIQRPYATYHIGQFYLRQERYGDAATTFKDVLGKLNENSDSGWIAQTRLQYALALWANGEREIASKMIVATSRCVGRSGVLAEVRAHVIVAKSILSPSDSGRISIPQGMREDNPFSLDAVVLVLAGKKPLEKQVQVVHAALDGAPRLEWALWSALYLGVARPDEAGKLLKVLPEGSLQKKIAEVETKATAETRPSRKRDVMKEK